MFVEILFHKFPKLILHAWYKFFPKALEQNFGWFLKNIYKSKSFKTVNINF